LFIRQKKLVEET